MTKKYRISAACRDFGFEQVSKTRFLPVLLVFIASFTDEASILKNGFSYFPEKWSMATVLIVIGPIMVVYPFFRKYFIKGLTVGSIKG